MEGKESRDKWSPAATGILDVELEEERVRGQIVHLMSTVEPYSTCSSSLFDDDDDGGEMGRG